MILRMRVNVLWIKKIISQSYLTGQYIKTKVIQFKLPQQLISNNLHKLKKKNQCGGWQLILQTLRHTAYRYLNIRKFVSCIVPEKFTKEDLNKD